MERKKFQSLFYDIDEFLVGAICDDIELCKEIDYPVYSRYFYPPNFWSRLENLNVGVIFSCRGLPTSAGNVYSGGSGCIDYSREIFKLPWR